jgi:hypothetical protein
VPYTKRNVLPRTYSLGACRSNRIALLCHNQPLFLTVFLFDAPDQNPFLAQLALGIVFRAYFEEEVHELLKRLRFAGHDESDDVHEEAGLRVAIEHDREDLLL